MPMAHRKDFRAANPMTRGSAAAHVESPLPQPQGDVKRDADPGERFRGLVYMLPHNLQNHHRARICAMATLPKCSHAQMSFEFGGCGHDSMRPCGEGAP